MTSIILLRKNYLLNREKNIITAQENKGEPLNYSGKTNLRYKEEEKKKTHSDFSIFWGFHKNREENMVSSQNVYNIMQKLAE